MLEAKVDKGISLKAAGDTLSIAAEIAAIINGVYSMIQDETEKEMFKHVMQRGSGMPKAGARACIWRSRCGRRGRRKEMTDKELIQALRLCGMHPVKCKSCPYNGVKVCVDVMKNAASDRLEALLAENEHLREVTKMVPRPELRKEDSDGA